MRYIFVCVYIYNIYVYIYINGPKETYAQDCTGNPLKAA